MSLPIYIINLKEAVERRSFQKQQLQKLGLKNYQFFNAISADDIDEKTYQKHYYDWQRPLQKTEVACFFSHQSLWKKVIENNQPALILEDDILLTKNIADLIIEFENTPQYDLINLENSARKKYLSKNSKSLSNKPYQLYRLYLDRTGSAAYILYPSGARKLLLCAQKKGIALSDAHIHNCYLLKSYQIEPSPAVQMVFADYYGIKNSNQHIAKSLIATQARSKSNFLFKIKRISAQIQLALYQLTLLTKAKKRDIKINQSLF